MIHKTQKEKPLTDQYFNLETNQNLETQVNTKKE